jgi:hypothetical protein
LKVTVDLTLIVVVQGEANENGYRAKTEYSTTVIAERISVNRTEFYEALKAGMKPTAIYRMHPLDLIAAQKTVNGVVYEAELATEGGMRYEIIRAYEKSPDTVEITCKKVT